jgi:hypothetical protein
MWMKSILAMVMLTAYQAEPPAGLGRQSASAARTKAEGVPERAPWSVTYHDGSGNGLRFRKDAEGEGAQFEYTPVRPENSSTGSYSGGEPKSGRMSERRARELWRWVRRLEADASLRADSRMKGTGAFSLTEPAGGAREFIVKRSAPLSEFDKFLAPFRSTPRRARPATR